MLRGTGCAPTRQRLPLRRQVLWLDSYARGIAIRRAGSYPVDEQVRRRFGIPLPVEGRYDEFTADVLANRLVKAAAYRLGRAGLRSVQARRSLGWVAAMLEDVALAEFAPAAVLSVRYDQLNEHYRGMVETAQLILRHGAFEPGQGNVRTSEFLMDLNVVFQEFVM